MTPSQRWGHLSHLQIGRYAEYFVKMQFVLQAFEIYTAEVDDRGIDFVLRKAPDRYWDIQVKSIRNSGYVFLRKSSFQIRENLLVALVIFKENSEPDIFIIPATTWQQPNTVFVDRDYKGLASQPEYGINVSQKGMITLEKYRS